MKIIDGLKLDGWRVEIPECHRTDLPEFFKEMGYKVGVEIGVYQGKFGKILAEGGLKVFGVDPYSNYLELVRFFGREDKITRNYDIAKENLKGLDYTIIRKTSMEALADFPDESIDFVYIDGNHAFKYVTEDIWEWSKKVRKGGIISGHDYINLVGDDYDVKAVVDAYTFRRQIPKWFLLGSKSERGRDKSRTWFWIKE